ncbi:MAG TPA: polysaccharide biosynthesis/export family protein [Polyangiales bacterium]|nr:polysaccharide biosynthesis/export family protein [Polyangiales bacterium]
MEMLRPRRLADPVLTRCVLLVLLALGLSACTATRVRVSEGTPLSRFLELSKPFKDRTYRVAIGDLLATRCYFNPQLDEEVLVRPDGNVSLSLIGEIKAVGRTAQELSAEITKAYSAYFLKSTAIVIVRNFNGHRVFTAGELKLPGMFSLMSSARTVLESISASGGATPEATLHKVVLMRRLPNQAQPMVAQLDVAAALSGDDPTQDVSLMPGDYIYVPRSGMAELNLVMHQYLLNNFNATTYAGIPLNIPALNK